MAPPVRSRRVEAALLDSPEWQRVRCTSAVERHQSPGEAPADVFGVATSHADPAGRPLMTSCRIAVSRSQRVPSVGNFGPNSHASDCWLIRRSTSGANAAVAAGRVDLMHVKPETVRVRVRIRSRRSRRPLRRTVLRRMTCRRMRLVAACGTRRRRTAAATCWRGSRVADDRVPTASGANPSTETPSPLDGAASVTPAGVPPARRIARVATETNRAVS